MQFVPLGDSALLLDFSDEMLEPETAAKRSLAAMEDLENARIAGVREITSSYRSVCLFLDLPALTSIAFPASFEKSVREIVSEKARRTRFRSRQIRIPVCYDLEFAPDVERVVAATSLSFSEIIRRHARAEYLTACVGFMPGFPYMLGLPSELHVPRLENPRTRVPAGSAAMAGAQAGIYPFESPGGWNIIGRTPLRLFNPEASHPVLVRPGDRVRYEKISRAEFDQLSLEERNTRAENVRSTAHFATAKVVSAGFQTTVQDCGRFGFRKFGVATAGALDAAALRLCNLLVGNEQTAAGLEFGSGRIRLCFSDDRLVAWIGGAFEIRADKLIVPARHCAAITAGTIVEIVPQRSGRGWLAISGGIDAPAIMGSRATDLRASFGGLNGGALRDGAELPLRKLSAESIRLAKKLTNGLSNWSAPLLTTRTHLLRILPGRNWNDVAPETRKAFLECEFKVSLNSDRMAVRFEPLPLISLERELTSEAVVPGTIQLPRSGAPILLLADCQTIGGYPKIAYVITADLGRAAQLQPGDSVRFALVQLQEAQELLLEQEKTIRLFQAGLQASFL